MVSSALHRVHSWGRRLMLTRRRACASALGLAQRVGQRLAVKMPLPCIARTRGARQQSRCAAGWRMRLGDAPCASAIVRHSSDCLTHTSYHFALILFQYTTRRGNLDGIAAALARRSAPFGAGVLEGLRRKSSEPQSHALGLIEHSCVCASFGVLWPSLNVFVPSLGIRCFCCRVLRRSGGFPCLLRLSLLLILGITMLSRLCLGMCCLIYFAWLLAACSCVCVCVAHVCVCVHMCS